MIEKETCFMPWFFKMLFLVLLKEEIERRCPELLKLGLLSEVGISTAGVKEQKRFVSFHHKTLQENSASKHIVKKLENSSNVQVSYLCDVSCIYCSINTRTHAHHLFKWGLKRICNVKVIQNKSPNALTILSF